MMNYLASLVLYGLLVLEFSYAAIFTHTWAVNIEGGEDLAKSIVEKHGFVYLGKVSKLTCEWCKRKGGGGGAFVFNNIM